MFGRTNRDCFTLFYSDLACPLCRSLWRPTPAPETVRLGDFFQHGETVSEDWDHLIIYDAVRNDLVIYILDTDDEETSL